MTDAPETIWAYTYDIQQDDMIWDVDLPTWSTTNPHPITAIKYRRDDLVFPIPFTTAQLMSDPRVKALVEAGEVMAQALRGDYIVPGSATNWGKALAQLKEPKP